MTETKQAASSGPPPTVEAQDPLPEGNWFWRRLFVFAMCAALLAFVWIKIDAVADVAKTGDIIAVTGLVGMLKMCLWLIGLLVLFYLLAPSAEQVTKMIQTGAALRSGVAFRSTSTATSAGGDVATTQTTAGVAPVGASVNVVRAEAPAIIEAPGNAPQVFPWSK